MPIRPSLDEGPRGRFNGRYWHPTAQRIWFYSTVSIGSRVSPACLDHGNYWPWWSGKKEPNSEIQIWEKMALTERVIKSVIPSKFHENSQIVYPACLLACSFPWHLNPHFTPHFTPDLASFQNWASAHWVSLSVISCHYSLESWVRDVYFWGQNSSFTKTRNHLWRSISSLETWKRPSSLSLRGSVSLKISFVITQQSAWI